MPTWNPLPTVSGTEIIGRRLLNKTGQERESGDNGCPLLEVDDFLETRRDADLSVDRLGNPNPNRTTLRTLTEIADKQASDRQPARTFDGWATIRARDLRFPGWVARIMATPSDENPFHADVSRDGFREKAQSYALAISMQQILTLKGDCEHARRASSLRRGCTRRS